MILKALYDYYQRCGDLAPIGMEYKELGFILVISKNGSFVRFKRNNLISILLKYSAKPCYDQTFASIGHCTLNHYYSSQASTSLNMSSHNYSAPS